MSPAFFDERFLRYQVKAIRRFQRLREPRTREEAQRLALEWIHRFAGLARRRWSDRAGGREGGPALDGVPWKT
jgi:hypothetical protein